MELKELQEIQRNFDRKHGWETGTHLEKEKLLMCLQQDLIGLFGEAGEFANVLKRITLGCHKRPPQDLNSLFSNSMGNLREEIVDTFIYLIRLADSLGVDLESEYLKKLQFNEIRHKEFEVPNE